MHSIAISVSVDGILMLSLILSMMQSCLGHEIARRTDCESAKAEFIFFFSKVFRVCVAVRSVVASAIKLMQVPLAFMARVFLFYMFNVHSAASLFWVTSLAESFINTRVQTVEGYCSRSMESDKPRSDPVCSFLDKIPGTPITVFHKSRQIVHASGERNSHIMCQIIKILHVFCKFLVQDNLNASLLVFSSFSFQNFGSRDDLGAVTAFQSE